MSLLGAGPPRGAGGCLRLMTERGAPLPVPLRRGEPITPPPPGALPQAPGVVDSHHAHRGAHAYARYALREHARAGPCSTNKHRQSERLWNSKAGVENRALARRFKPPRGT